MGRNTLIFGRGKGSQEPKTGRLPLNLTVPMVAVMRYETLSKLLCNTCLRTHSGLIQNGIGAPDGYNLVWSPSLESLNYLPMKFAYLIEASSQHCRPN